MCIRDRVKDSMGFSSPICMYCLFDAIISKIHEDVYKRQINKYILNGKSPELTFRGFLHIYRLQFIIEFCCQNILLPFHSKNQNCQSTGADR